MQLIFESLLQGRLILTGSLVLGAFELIGQKDISSKLLSALYPLLFYLSVSLYLSLSISIYLVWNIPSIFIEGLFHRLIQFLLFLGFGVTFCQFAKVIQFHLFSKISKMHCCQITSIKTVLPTRIFNIFL